MGLKINKPEVKLLSFEELKTGVIYVINSDNGFDERLCQKIYINDLLGYRFVMFGYPGLHTFDDVGLKERYFEELSDGSVINYSKT